MKTKPRIGQVYVFNPVGWDIIDARSNTPAAGSLVRVVRPHGCPPVGTMGHCHVEATETGALALVHINSLQPKGTK